MNASAKKRIAVYLISIAIFSLAVTMLLPALRPAHAYSGPGIKQMCEVEMRCLAQGLEQYRIDQGSYPTNSDEALFAALTSRNTDGSNYVSFRPSLAWKFPEWKNSFVDPWGTAYDIKKASHTNVLIRSAGPNRVFGDTDDLTLDTATDPF